MLEQKKYIGTLIRDILKHFREVSVKYEYVQPSDSHLIEISPKTIYESPEFESFMATKVFEFYNLFPETGIAFVTDDSLVHVSNPEIHRTNESMQIRPLTIAVSDLDPALPMIWTFEDSRKQNLMALNYPLPRATMIPTLNVEYAISLAESGLDVREIEQQVRLMNVEDSTFLIESEIESTSGPRNSFWGIWGWTHKAQTRPSYRLSQYATAA